VLVGDQTGIFIPELPRSREFAGRLRGLRLLHTHLTDSPLSQEDFMDLLFLRLDSVSVLTVDQWGEPLRFQSAHLLPANPQNETHRAGPLLRWDGVETDFTAEVVALEEELARLHGPDLATAQAPAAEKRGRGKSSIRESAVAGSGGGLRPETRAILVSVSTAPRHMQESAIKELAELAETAGVHVAGTLIQRVQSINPRSILGKGKLAELEVQALQGNAGLVIFDGELSPAQLRNLTEITERRVLDRTQLILDIFAQRASSRAGKCQVELAQLQYMLPRLVGKSGGALDRLAGGIGGRGPGETKLETDRRRLRDRVARIRDELKELRRQRAFARSRRAKGNVPVASLVGYTNAGKSTLLNALTGSGVLAENRLFATLDPTTRRLRFPMERELIITDTVGFIRSLPKELVEAFRATLEELEEADLLLHVADASHPELDLQLGAVEGILAQLELQERPVLLVLNKMDSLSEEAAESLRAARPEAVCISARTGEGLKDLSAAIVSRIDWQSAAEGAADAEYAPEAENAPATVART
jgi:GTP-binding protein HflX